MPFRNARANPLGPCWNVQMPSPITLTIPEAIKASGMSRTAIYEALKFKRISAKKAGRRTLISYADLQAYLASLPPYQAGA